MTLVRKLRQALGWSQERFAQRVARSTASIRMYESGREIPSDVLAVMLAMAHRGGLKDLAREIEVYAVEHRFLSTHTPATEEPELETTEDAEKYLGDQRRRAHAMLDEIWNDASTFVIAERVLEVFSYWVKSGRFAHQLDEALSHEGPTKTKDESPADHLSG